MMQHNQLTLSKYRSEFPFTNKVTFLNHASFGPLPKRSWNATLEYYKYLRLEKTEDIDRVSFRKLDEIRVIIAKMLKAMPEEVGV